MTNAASMTVPAEPAEWTLPSPRKVAVACLIATEAALFTIFVVAYLFYIGKSVSGPSPAQVLDVPIWATVCLLSSSLTIMRAQRALGQQRLRRFQLWWGLTILLGAAFLWATAREWYRLIVRNNVTISTNLFGTTFYSLVGLHATHVTVGLVLLFLVFVFSLRGYVRRAYGERIEMLAWYWHFVDVVWVVVFTVVYLISC
jgi:cytochrome c oxidase subunit 3/cytochrome o ubiquinol oxidase subunit 3